MKYPTFEKYLEGQCDYEGVLDDDMPDHLDNWISNLDTQEVMDYAESYVSYIKREIRGELTWFNKWLSNEI